MKPEEMEEILANCKPAEWLPLIEKGEAEAITNLEKELLWGLKAASKSCQLAVEQWDHALLGWENSITLNGAIMKNSKKVIEKVDSMFEEDAIRDAMTNAGIHGLVVDGVLRELKNVQ